MDRAGLFWTLCFTFRNLSLAFYYAQFPQKNRELGDYVSLTSPWDE